MTANMKPADQLATLRKRIKAMQEEEKGLRLHIIETGETNGDFAIVSISRRTRKTFDRKAAEAVHGDLSEFDKVSEYDVLNVDELEIQE